MGTGQIDIAINIGVGGERNFKAGFVVPSDMVRQAVEIGQLNNILSMFLSREVERVTTLMMNKGKNHLTVLIPGKRDGAPVARNASKLECLKALISKGEYYNDIVSFLSKHEAVSKQTLSSLMTPDPLSKHTMLYDAIEQASLIKTVTLAHYSWVVLPKERIQIDLVGTMEHKTFIYEEA